MLTLPKLRPRQFFRSTGFLPIAAAYRPGMLGCMTTIGEHLTRKSATVNPSTTHVLRSCGEGVVSAASYPRGIIAAGAPVTVNDKVTLLACWHKVSDNENIAPIGIRFQSGYRGRTIELRQGGWSPTISLTMWFSESATATVNSGASWPLFAGFNAVCITVDAAAGIVMFYRRGCAALGSQATFSPNSWNTVPSELPVLALGSYWAENQWYGAANTAPAVMLAVWNYILPEAIIGQLSADPFTVFETKQIVVPTGSVGYTHPTLSNATATDITTTSFRPRVTYTFS